LNWPGEDLAILGLIVFYALTTVGLIALLRARIGSTGTGKVVSEA
jgi:hypothetical protein